MATGLSWDLDEQRRRQPRVPGGPTAPAPGAPPTGYDSVFGTGPKKKPAAQRNPNLTTGTEYGFTPPPAAAPPIDPYMGPPAMGGLPYGPQKPALGPPAMGGLPYGQPKAPGGWDDTLSFAPPAGGLPYGGPKPPGGMETPGTPPMGGLPYGPPKAPVEDPYAWPPVGGTDPYGNPKAGGGPFDDPAMPPMGGTDPYGNPKAGGAGDEFSTMPPTGGTGPYGQPKGPEPGPMSYEKPDATAPSGGPSTGNPYAETMSRLQQAADPQEQAVLKDKLARDVFAQLKQAGHDVKWQGDQLMVDGRPYVVGGGAGPAASTNSVPAGGTELDPNGTVQHWGNFNPGQQGPPASTTAAPAPGTQPGATTNSPGNFGVPPPATTNSALPAASTNTATPAPASTAPTPNEWALDNQSRIQQGMPPRTFEEYSKNSPSIAGPEGYRTPAALITDAYRKFLGRDPSAAEIAGQTGNGSFGLRDPRLMASAKNIMSSPEAQAFSRQRLQQSVPTPAATTNTPAAGTANTRLMEGDPNKLKDPAHAAKSPKYDFLQLAQQGKYSYQQLPEMLAELQAGPNGRLWQGWTASKDKLVFSGNPAQLAPEWNGATSVDAIGGFNSGNPQGFRWGVEGPGGGGGAASSGIPVTPRAAAGAGGVSLTQPASGAPGPGWVQTPQGGWVPPNHPLAQTPGSTTAPGTYTPGGGPAPASGVPGAPGAGAPGAPAPPPPGGYTPGDIPMDDIPSFSWEQLANQGTAPTDQATNDLMMSILKNPESMDPRTVEMMKARSKDELAEMQATSDAELRAQGGALGIGDSAWLQSERNSGARARDLALVKSNRDIETGAAATNAADKRSAAALGSSVSSAQGQRKLAGAQLAADTTLRTAAMRGDRMALRESLKQKAAELGLSEKSMMLEYTLGLMDDATRRYGIDIGASLDRAKLSQAGREFQEDLAFRFAQLMQNDAQFGASFGLDHARTQAQIDRDQWDRYQSTFGT